MLRKKRLTRGQSLVEMAILFPFFLLVVVGGIIDFGFAFYNSLTLQQIANDTSRWAAESNTNQGVTSQGQIESYANAKKPNWWQGRFTVHPLEIVTFTSAGGARGIRIRISYESPTYTPFYQTLLGAVSGNPNIPLAVAATYQIPQTVVTR